MRKSANWFLNHFIYKKLVGKTCFLALCLLPALLFGQKVQITGSVTDPDGEKLPFATILVIPDSTSTIANENGIATLKTSPGKKRMIVKYTGYKLLKLDVFIRKDTSIAFSLEPYFDQLEEVTITSKRYSQEHLVPSVSSGTISLTKKDITSLPAIGGEADVIKALLLLPGSTRGVEGSSDIFVRGGAADQNLVLLDGFPIYNTGHLFGFLSVFNTDILDQVKAVHGGFPAEYGGRLSSILHITSNNRIAEKTNVSGEIGLIASRLYFEQPLIKDKLSVWVAGRRSYLDQVFKATGEDLPYYFYDLNGKIIYKPTSSDQIELSYYGGQDIFDYSRNRDKDGYEFSSKYNSGNTSQVLHWKHQNPNGWNSSLALNRTTFQYYIRNSFKDNKLVSFSDIEDYGAKVSFSNDTIWKNTSITTGLEWTRHAVSPLIINSTGFFSDIRESSANTAQEIHEAAGYIQHEWALSKRFLIRTGFRGSMALLHHKEYFMPEPRLALRYSIRDHQSVKLSYSRMAQYMYRISNSAISSPTDIWYPVTKEIPPQNAHQFSTAWHTYIPAYNVFISTEGYFKEMHNLVGYEEGTNLFINSDFASQLIRGTGRAYGFEFLMRKEAGKLSGWLSYSLSWSWRQFDDLNNGKWFPSRYDRRHNGAVVMNYKLHSRWEASLVWEFISGSRFTPILGQYVVTSPSFTGVELVPLFSRINQVKLADSHRLDLGIKFSSKPMSRFSWHVFAGVNNVYNRASPIGIFIEKDKKGKLYYSQPGLFGLLPFLSFGFNF